MPDEIPRRLFYKIGEVCQLTDTQPYVLRFWESEFPQLAPKKSRSGQRLYRRRDIDLVLEIKKLLYEEGFTIAGARRKLGLGEGPVGMEDLFEDVAGGTGAAPPGAAAAGEDLREVGRGLRDLLRLMEETDRRLSGRGGRPR